MINRPIDPFFVGLNVCYSGGVVMAAGENEWNESMIGGDGEGAGESVAILLSNTQGGTKMRERRWIIRELWMISRSLRREQTEMIRKLVGEGSKRRSLGWWGGERDSLPWGESIVLSEWRVLMVDGELSLQLNEWSIESMVIE